MGWTNTQTESLTIPPEGGVPRIFIGGGDPLAVAAGAIASIVFYWQSDEAFILDVLFDGLHTGQLRFSNSDPSGTVAEYINMFYNEDTGAQALTFGSTDHGLVTDIEFADVDSGNPGDFTILGVSQGRGHTAQANITSNSSAISAETVVLTLPSTVFKSGRAYEIQVGGRVQASATNTALFRLRFGTTTGGSLVLTYGGVGVTTSGATSAANVSLSRYVIRDPGDGDLTTQMVVTMASSTGTDTLLAASNEPAYIEVIDVGSWEDFPGVFL